MASIQQSASAPALERKAYRVEEAAQLLGVGRTTIYAEIRAGRLAVCKIGKCSIITSTELDRFLANLSTAAAE